MTRLFEAKPFIIAEVGSNWHTLEHCIESIDEAKQCGADAVKFQLFDAISLYGTDQHPDVWRIDEMALDRTWLPELKNQADACGIEFMCTAFSPELVAAVDPFVSVHKVASSDAAWPQMLEAVARTGKPVLLSTGAKTEYDVGSALDIIEGRCRVIPLLCVASYPADLVDLDGINEMRNRHELEVGFSDHTLGYSATVEAVRYGAIVIEKHFTAFPDLDTPDRPHSLTPVQFKRMVDIIRGRPVESEESAMFKRHNRRLIATRDITAGAAMEYGTNFGAYRSLVDDDRGLSPFEWERVQGTQAAKAIPRGTAIGEGDFA